MIELQQEAPTQAYMTMAVGAYRAASLPFTPQNDALTGDN
jgi:hypothetical protein